MSSKEPVETFLSFNFYQFHKSFFSLWKKDLFAWQEPLQLFITSLLRNVSPPALPLETLVGSSISWGKK